MEEVAAVPKFLEELSNIWRTSRRSYESVSYLGIVNIMHQSTVLCSTSFFLDHVKASYSHGVCPK